MKKKSHKSVIKKKGHLRKFGHIVLFASAVFIGLVFAQNGLNNQDKKTPPKIDSVSPAVGFPSALVTITGSGFTTQQEHDARIKSVKDLPPGNYLRIAGAGTMGPPSFSPDGKTLKFQLALDTTQVPKNCVPGKVGPKCQISLQVVNGEGSPSNIVHFQLYIPTRPLVVSMSLDSQNPPAQNITPGATDVEVLRFKIKADSTNPVNIDLTDFVVKTIPTYIADWDLYCKDFLKEIKVVDASTGELMGSYPSFPDSVVNCSSSISTWLPLSPGEERMFSVKLSIPAEARSGLQFRIAIEKMFNNVDFASGGDDANYAAVTSNLITIIP